MINSNTKSSIGKKGISILSASVVINAYTQYVLCARETVGKDGIWYIMIKHLSEGGLNKLLSLFNEVWKEGHVPAGRKPS